MNKKDYNKEYIELHSDILNQINSDFWRREICKYLNEFIDNSDEEAKEALLVNPFDWFIIEDVFIFGYIPTFRQLYCLNESIFISELDHEDVFSAISAIFMLYGYYGRMNGTYEGLLKECSRLCL